tara:strand:+ start:10304 stop:11164 length:861 start_codon:yes stop_codon:yes gene_type:complete
MSLLCIADKPGRIQHNRLKALKKYYEFDIATLSDKVDVDKYDCVYYSHFSLYKKMPTKKRKFTSVTSHKCLDDMDDTLSRLSKFDRVSVNNMFLLKAFKPHIKNLFYTPNGVDTKFFRQLRTQGFHTPKAFGWVGNRDRATKNYNSIFKPLGKTIGPKYNFAFIAPSKSDPLSALRNAGHMLGFYNNMDFFLVTSSTEGTPNPALEALACCVPIITTRVGNMIEIIKDGENGFFAEDNTEDFTKVIKKASSISEEKYQNMRKRARESIEPWDWKLKKENWAKFLEL